MNLMKNSSTSSTDSFMNIILATVAISGIHYVLWPGSGNMQPAIGRIRTGMNSTVCLPISLAETKKKILHMRK